MMLVFLLAWALGAWLLFMCTALVWAERIRIYRRLPVCASCGYNMEGLPETNPCPECASTTRLRKAVTGTSEGSAARLWLWSVPFGVSIIASILMSITLGFGSIQALCLQGAMSAMALGLSLLTRSLVRLLPPAVIVRMALIGSLTITMAAVGFALLVRSAHLRMDLWMLLLFLVVVWPFCGYGMALALATVPAEAWLREMILRVRNADRLE